MPIPPQKNPKHTKHEDVIVQGHDWEREMYLKKIASINILRFENEEVTSNTEAVIEVIHSWIKRNYPH